VGFRIRFEGVDMTIGDNENLPRQTPLWKQPLFWILIAIHTVIGIVYLILHINHTISSGSGFDDIYVYMVLPNVFYVIYGLIVIDVICLSVWVTKRYRARRK